MKHIYLTISVLFFTLTGFSQGYQFGIVQNANYNFSIVAIPDFNGTNTDISDVGFTLMLPAGNADVTNLTQFNGRAWSATEVTATQLTSLTLGDGTRDAFVMNLPPGQTILSHTNGQQIVLVTFVISNMPTTGELEILLNNDAIAVGLGGALDSFYNSNINSTTTQDYFSGIASGMGSFMFSTLGIENLEVNNFQIKVFPNPASDKIFIKSDTDITKIEMYDILGKSVLTSNQKQEIKVNHLKEGIYFIKILTNEGQATKKIIIK